MQLLFGLHLHQPVDNLSVAVEKAVAMCYRPLFATLKKYPEFKFSLHCSGWLFTTLKERYPDVFENIAYLNEQGSIEFFTAGFYEPILSSIPKEDQIAQIELLSTFIEDNFKKVPKGVWLTERVWQDSIIHQLKKCSLEYVMVDDYHLELFVDRFDGYYYTEDEGEQIALFPISKELRYKIPFWKVEEAIDAIKTKECAIIFDDGEKFGLWPGTYDWVYNQRWLEKFIEAVLQDPDIEPLHFSECLQRTRSLGLVYLPNVSYYEMGEWSLRPKDTLKIQEYEKMVESRYLRGGIWKNFFVKYPESNHIHKRMLSLSKKIKTDALYKLQTNDVFWHGVFGGLYLPNLRDNAYRYLIECENDLNDNTMEVADIDMDGFLEAKLANEKAIYMFSQKNGALIEFDDKEKLFNFQNTLTRYKEAYHEKMQQEHSKHDGIETIHEKSYALDEEFKKYFHFDSYTKHSFLDHISDEDFAAHFAESSFKEYVKFKAFDIQTSKNSVTFSQNLPECAITKTFTLQEDLNFTISLDTSFVDKKYIVECNFHFAHYDTLEIAKEYIYDPYTGKRVVFAFDKDYTMTHFLLKTISQSEKGYDLTIQGVSIAFIFDLEKNFRLQGKLCLR